MALTLGLAVCLPAAQVTTATPAAAQPPAPACVKEISRWAYAGGTPNGTGTVHLIKVRNECSDVQHLAVNVRLGIDGKCTRVDPGATKELSALTVDNVPGDVTGFYSCTP